MKKITLCLAVLSMTFANAQQLSTSANNAHTIQPVSNAVLYDQQDGTVTTGIINLFNNDEDFGVWATDDFELTTASDLGVITAYGFNNDGAALINITNVSLYIYANIEGVNIPDGDPTIPGSGLVELVDIEVGTPGLDIISDGFGPVDLAVDVPVIAGETVTLPAGSYWLVVTPSMDGLTGLPLAARWNQYGAGTGPGFGAGNAHLIDPSDAFNSGFTSWTDYAAIGLDFFSTAFTVEGEENLSLYSNVKEAVSIYPNPAVNVINLQMPSVVEIKSATIFNLLGQEIEVRVTNNQIDVSDLAQGVHILKLETNQGRSSRKFVKK
jgi:hypothetical protein